MARIVQLGTRQEREAGLVAGMYERSRAAEDRLYSYCADYYYEKYRGVFYAPEDAVDEIFQNSFIKFWENIAARILYVEDGLVMAKDGRPLNGSIRTYFMGIAKLKYLEWLREHPHYADPETEMGKKIREEGFNEAEYMQMLYGESDNIQLEIIADIISHMSERCNEILTKFYYEEKTLDRIWEEIPTISSKDALKTKKNQCMENLRVSANETYKRYLKYT